MRNVCPSLSLAAVALLVLPRGELRWALLVGIALYLLVHVGTWFLVSRMFAGTPGPSPVVE